MPKVGDTITLVRSGRDYLVCSVTPVDTVLRSDDGLASIVWTRDVVNAIQDGKIVFNLTK
jgi:hypothetical protein